MVPNTGCRNNGLDCNTFLSLTVTVAIIFFALGPIIQVIESTVISGLVSLINAPFGIGYILFGGLQQVLTITGLHHSLGIIEFSLLSDTGLNMIQPLTTASMAGQFGAAIGTAFLMKDKIQRTNMISLLQFLHYSELLNR